MANLIGEQPEIAYCPVCAGGLENVPRAAMVSSGYVSQKTGAVAAETHTYQCKVDPTHRFEINQAR